MRRVPFFLSLLAGALIFLISVIGFFYMKGRPGLPQGISEDSIVRIGQNVLKTHRDIDFVLSQHKVGDTVLLHLKKDGGGEEEVEIRLVPYYSQATFPVIFLVIGAFAFGIGLVVFLLRFEDPAARLFYAATSAFAASVIVSGELYGLRGTALSYLPPIVFNFAYPLAPAILWRFSRTFLPPRENTWFRAFWPVPIGFGLVFNYVLLYSHLRPSLATFQTQQQYFFLFRAYVIVICLAAIIDLVRAFRKSTSDAARARIKWIFLGLSVGLGPFVFLYQLPQVLGIQELLSEDLSSAFFFLIPVALAVAILRFRLMDIDLVINRSIVYSLLTVFTVGIYLVSVELLQSVFVKTAMVRNEWLSLGAAFVAAVAFQPGRKRIQLLVDRTFFRQASDYAKTVRHFTETAQQIVSPEELLLKFRDETMNALPVERLGILVNETWVGETKALYRQGVDERAAAALAALAPAGGRILAKEAGVKTTDALDLTRQAELKSLGFEIVLPLPLGPGVLTGYLAVGRKKSEQKFTREDLDMLETLAGELAMGLHRIRLQQEVLSERASREKADELSRLKTEFVSSVSHELRNPMSSLQGLSELLQSGKVRDEAQRERFLQLMAGECGRLSRFLHNVLDFGRIEQGTRVYSRERGEVQPVIKEVVEIVRTSLPPEGLSLGAEMPEKPVMISMDRDAVCQAVLNLVDNALKYSRRDRKDVTVRLVDGAGEAEIQVEDKGIGIEPENQEKIFDAFFRSPAAVQHNPKGVGLGLKIVKHIMDAHGGRIGLRSEPGQGSTFSLIFPKGGGDEKDPDR